MDPSSATELLAQVPIEGSVANPRSKYASGNEDNVRPQINQSRTQSQSQEEFEQKSRSRQERYSQPAEPESLCKAHPDEEAKYFCFDCLVPPVCSECVIHGAHKGHDAQHVKKAYPLVREKLEGVVQGLSTCIDELEGDRKGVEAKKQVVSSQAEEAKAQCKIMFDDLRARIDKKEREVLAHIEASANDSLKEMDSYERSIEDKLATLGNNVKYIKENMSSGVLSTLTFFADNNKILSQAVEQEAREKGHYASEFLSKGTHRIDTEALRGLKEAVGSVAEVLGRVRVFAGGRASAADRGEDEGEPKMTTAHPETSSNAEPAGEDYN